MASQESVARVRQDEGLIEIEEEDPRVTYHAPQTNGRHSHRASLRGSDPKQPNTTYVVEHIHDMVRKEERFVEVSRGLGNPDDAPGVSSFQLRPGQEGHSFVGPRMKNPLRKPYPPHADSVCPMNAAVKHQLETGGDLQALQPPQCEDDRDVFTTDVEVPRLMYKVVPKYVDVPVKVQKIVPRRRIVKKVVKRPIFVPIEEISYQDVPRVERRLVRQKLPIWIGQPPNPPVGK